MLQKEGISGRNANLEEKSPKQDLSVLCTCLYEAFYLGFPKANISENFVTDKLSN